MRDRAPLWVLLAALLTLLGIKTLPSGSHAPGQEASQNSKERPSLQSAKEVRSPAEEVSSPADREFWRPLIDFVDTGDAWRRYAAGGQPWEGFPLIEGWEMHSLIALMPDPQESNVGYRFDSLVDALQRAVETCDYVLDRYSFPWRQTSTSAETVPLATSEGKRPSKPIFERQPGLLLFRDMAKKRLLLVLLVGETATAGIHKQAFITSLQFIVSLRPPGEPILLLGPCYSGSQNSLEQAITHWAAVCKRHPPPTFRIISGTATAIERDDFHNRCVGATVTFQATVIPENVKLDRLLRFLQYAKLSNPWLASPIKVACLCESNTGFGSSFNRKLKQIGEPNLIFFPFPLHISETRSSYVVGGVETQNVLQLPTLGRKIRIPFDSGPDVRETEPTLTPAMTAVTSERILATMLSTLARENYRYAVIVATDVRDKIFLATLVRQFCPEIRLLFTGNDMLLSHPDYSYYLNGSLIASTYPLLPMNQHWSFPFRAEEKRLIFPSEAEYGLYNAAIALLNWNNPKGLQNLLEYGPPLNRLAEQDRGRPPVWISIIGQNGPQPLDVSPIRAIEEADQQGEEAYLFAVEGVNLEGNPKFSLLHDTIWIAARLVVMLFAMVVLAAFAFVLWRHRQGVTIDDDYHSGLIALLWPRSPDLQYAQRAYVWRCFLATFVLFAYLGLVCVLPTACRLYGILYGSDFVALGWTDWLFPLATVLLVAAFPALALWKKYGTFQTPLPAPPYRTFRQFVRSLSLVHWASLLLLAIALVHLLTHVRMMEIGRSVLRNLFFYERATNLSGGVSPVVPVVFLSWAFVAWSICQLKRLYLLDRHSVAIPFPGNETTGHFSRIHARHAQLAQFLHDPHQVGATRASVFIWLLLLFVLYRFSDNYVPTVEGIWYDTFLFLGLALFCLVLVYALMQAFRLWRSIHELLHVIAPLRLKGVFSRIPTSVTRLFGPYLSAERSGREPHLWVRWEQRQLLLTRYGVVHNALQQALGVGDAAQAFLDRRLGYPAQSSDLPQRGDDAQAQLRDTAQTCLIILGRLWKHLPVNRTFGGPISSIENEENSAQPPLPDGFDAPLCGWLALAEEYVAVEVIAYLSQFFVQLRNLLVFLTISPLFMLFAATSYPFHPQRLWMMFSGALILAAAFIAVTIFIQIERDEVVSRISGTRPNKLDFHWDFFANICTYALPLLGILLATSTDLADLIHAWLDPLFQLGK
jgi:hypothetical protein